MDFWLSASVVVTFLDCNQFVSTLKNCNRNPILDFDPKFPEIVGIGCDWGELSGYLKNFPEIPSLKKKILLQKWIWTLQGPYVGSVKK